MLSAMSLGPKNGFGDYTRIGWASKSSALRNGTWLFVVGRKGRLDNLSDRIAGIAPDKNRSSDGASNSLL